MKGAAVDILNKTGHTIPRVPFAVIKNNVLPKDYRLSLVFVPEKTSCRLNRDYRGKNKPTNVLAFPLSKRSGEIIMDISKIKKETALLKTSLKNWLTFLFIHALLHLKGMRHGSKMENKEKSLFAKWSS